MFLIIATGEVVMLSIEILFIAKQMQPCDWLKLAIEIH